jgi:DNA-binding response OmpR family regulator
MKKVLVIEDEKAVMNNLLEILDSGGFQGFGAENGSEGIQLAKEELPDLIICDIMMPDTDGYEVLRTLRENSETAMIPFIFLTAKTEQPDLRQGMNLGADDYITKPFRRNELLDSIAVRLEKRALIAEQYLLEQRRREELQQRLHELQHVNITTRDLLSGLTQDLRRPLANINLALHLIKEAQSDLQRRRYLEILQEEFSQEITLLNQVSELQQLLTPENIKLLQQFNLLKG